MKRIGIVAAEPSGDQLAGFLIEALQRLEPNLVFEGIAGEKMQARGCTSWFPMEKLSVMGLVEVVKHLRELLGIRKSLVKRWQINKPDLFIGVDAPDFNLGLEKRLHAMGIPTVQYVSPTFWAWRPGRLDTLRRFTNLVLSIFPFEAQLLSQHKVSAVYAGHPLVQQMRSYPDKSTARQQLSLGQSETILAVLPGSRMSEARFLTNDFLTTAQQLKQQKPHLKIILPLATGKIREHVVTELAKFPGLDIQLIDQQSQTVLAAADVVLVASGTAALETLLHRKPMVVAYKAHWLTYFILFRLGLVKSAFIAMPNILAGREIVAEMFQEKCQPQLMTAQLLSLMNDEQKRTRQLKDYEAIIDQLSGGNINDAAAAILELING